MHPTVFLHLSNKTWSCYWQTSDIGYNLFALLIEWGVVLVYSMRQLQFSSQPICTNKRLVRTRLIQTQIVNITRVHPDAADCWKFCVPASFQKFERPVWTELPNKLFCWCAFMRVRWLMWVYSKLMVTLVGSGGTKTKPWSCAVDGPVHVHLVSVSSTKAELLQKSHSTPIKRSNLPLKKSLTTIKVIPPLIPNYASCCFFCCQGDLPATVQTSQTNRWTGITPLLEEQKRVIQRRKLAWAHYFRAGSWAVWAETDTNWSTYSSRH